MKNVNKFGLGLLLSVAIIGGVSVINAKTGEVAMPTTTKAELNTAVDVTRADLKVRVVDVSSAMQASEEGQDFAKKVEPRRQQLAQDIEAKGKAYEDAMTKLKSQASTMNEAALAKKKQELVKMERDYKDTLENSEGEMKLVIQQGTGIMIEGLSSSVEQLAKKEGLDLVVDKNSGQIVYSSGKADITAQVVKEMNKHYSSKLARNDKTASSVLTVVSNKKAPAAA
ncbi:MAG: OmpH family outer membrane protein [Candidatus Dependentiae bacterium]|nr:OmpH family outer membrane protein [Candidatus Dependentiae bacterium]